jgi:hypothetical protein
MTGEQQEFFPQQDADIRQHRIVDFALDSADRVATPGHSKPFRNDVLGVLDAYNTVKVAKGGTAITVDPSGVSDEIPEDIDTDKIIFDVVKEQMVEIYTLDMAVLAQLENFDKEIIRKLLDPERVARFGSVLKSDEMFVPYLSMLFNVPVEDLQWLTDCYQLRELAWDKYADVDYRPSTLLFLYLYSELRLEGLEQGFRPGIVTIFAGRIEQKIQELAA